MLQKAEFLSKLDIQLGEQKIDVLVSTGYNSHLAIIKTDCFPSVAGQAAVLAMTDCRAPLRFPRCFGGNDDVGRLGGDGDTYFEKV